MAKITKSTSRSIRITSIRPTAGSMTAWALRDFVATIDAAGIPDDVTIQAEHAYDTRHFIGLSIRHVEQQDEAV